MRSLEFDPSAFEDLAWWIERDRKKAMRDAITHTKRLSIYFLNRMARGHTVSRIF